MTRRTHITNLQNTLNAINRAAGFDPDNLPYSTIGAYDLDQNCGGVALVQYANNSGAERTVLPSAGKREMHDMMRAYYAGMMAMRDIVDGN